MMKRIGELKAENARLKSECQARQAENSVLAVECDSLKAEVERLEEIVGSDAIDRKYGMCCDASDEIARLKAEVERLTKAGDAMIDEWWLQLSCPERMKASWMQEQAIVEWNAAKKGGQP